jgi:ABC-type antimicrobial peptide transport system permease subunit
VEALVTETGAQGAGGAFGFPLRILSLIVVSLLVCVVGIVNAMLMSVTERFTEIATMKCLGATDGVVMSNFMLEAGFQGVVGGGIGGVMGLLLGLLRAGLIYGSLAIRQLPVAELAMMFAVIVVIGVLLSVVAAVYPAWLAARLSPMEAMRVE